MAVEGMQFPRRGERRYNFPEFGGYLGNVGYDRLIAAVPTVVDAQGVDARGVDGYALCRFTCREIECEGGCHEHFDNSGVGGCGFDDAG